MRIAVVVVPERVAAHDVDAWLQHSNAKARVEVVVAADELRNRGLAQTADGRDEAVGTTALVLPVPLPIVNLDHERYVLNRDLDRAVQTVRESAVVVILRGARYEFVI